MDPLLGVPSLAALFRVVSENLVCSREVTAEQLREMLLDLPHNPGLPHVRSVTLGLGADEKTGESRFLELHLPPDVAAQAGSAGVQTPGGLVRENPAQALPSLLITPSTLHRQAVRNMLSNAPVTTYTEDL
jgi:hypothetical protein